jgi:hypothetical protein
VPVKLRTPKGRRPFFSDEVLDLFRRLSAMPKRPRPPEWKEQSQRLAEQLGLLDEWPCMRFVEDEPSGHVPENSYQRDAYYRVAEAREKLLAAIAERASVN